MKIQQGFTSKLELEVVNDNHTFLARGELSGWLGNQDVRGKQWKVCNRFPIVSSSAGAFMHSLNGR